MHRVHKCTVVKIFLLNEWLNKTWKSEWMNERTNKRTDDWFINWWIRKYSKSLNLSQGWMKFLCTRPYIIFLMQIAGPMLFISLLCELLRCVIVPASDMKVPAYYFKKLSIWIGSPSCWFGSSLFLVSRPFFPKSSQNRFYSWHFGKHTVAWL